MKYPKINYIGNKDKVASWIIENLPIKKGLILDLFCGGCSVSYAMKKAGFTVYSNDSLFSNYAIAKALIENANTKLNITFDETSIKSYFTDETFKKINWLTNKIYFEEEVKELAALVNFSMTLKSSEKFIFLALLRRAMIRKIPYSRMNIKWEEIVKLRDEEYSYKKYKRRRAYHNKTFTYHILKYLEEYNLAIFDNKKKNKAYQTDAVELINNMPFSVDLIYLDPPYPSTMNKYNDFYGYYDKIFEKEIEIKVDFVNKEKFLNNIYDLIVLAKNKTKYIVMSLNNKCKPSADEIYSKISNIVKKVEIKQKEHIYKVTGKENKNKNYEILMIIYI